jgi:hypothetical protein
MSHHASAHRARVRLELLEDRCTPSTLLGAPSAQLLGHHRGPAAAHVAHFGANETHTVPITLSLRCAADISSMTWGAEGFGTLLGHWTARGQIDNIVSDPVANRIVISGTLTLVAANHDELFVSVSSAWDQSTPRVEDTVTFTGGTGKFAGATGHATLECSVTVDSTSPLKLSCDGKGSGVLILAHNQQGGAA